MTLSYETVFSRYRLLSDDPKELSIDPNDLYEIYNERLHTVSGNPNVMAKFSTFELSDDIQTIEFSLKYPVNDFADKEFVANLLSLGMTVLWLKPQVDSIKYTSIILGEKEEKALQNHYKPMIDRLHELELQFTQLLSNHGYINNSYLRGE